MTRNVLQSSIRNASFSIVFQIICRCVTFGINAYILRHVGHEALGVMNVRLLLLESTLIFLSREAISRSALSAISLQRNKCTWRQLVNQMWITVPLCVCLCGPLYYIWMHVLSPQVNSDLIGQYRFGCLAIAGSCVVELCAEAPVFVGQVFCFVKLKVVMDTLHVLIRSLVFIVLVWRNTEYVIWAFGIAQMASILTILIGNYGFFYFYIRKLKAYRQAVQSKKDDDFKADPYYANMDDFPFQSLADFLPTHLRKSSSNESNFNEDLKTLAVSFFKQGLLKQVLTEGEKYVMSMSPVLTFSEQATYDVVNNMGSLAARFIFRPIEDSSYFYFTQTLSRDVPLAEQKPEKVAEASSVLSNVCKGVMSIGLLGFVFGQSYSGTLLLLYGGKDFVDGGLPELLLRWHCLSIVLMAINGISEGYMFATNTSQQINRYNYYMAIFSVTFLALSYQLTTIFGPVGFILANCTNMILRIGYSLHYIRSQYGSGGGFTTNAVRNPLLGLWPGAIFSGMLVISGIVCAFSQRYILPKAIIYHIAIGALCTGLTVAGWMWENRKITKVLLNKFKRNLQRR